MEESEKVLSHMASGLPQEAGNVKKYVWEKVNSAVSFSGGGKILDEGTPIEFHIEGRNDSFIDVNVSGFLCLTPFQLLLHAAFF